MTRQQLTYSGEMHILFIFIEKFRRGITIRNGVTIYMFFLLRVLIQSWQHFKNINNNFLKEFYPLFNKKW